MTIEVRREYLALTFPSWPPIEVTIWQETGPPFHPPCLFESAPPAGYAPGLLRGYIDGRAVSFEELSAVLYGKVNGVDNGVDLH